MARDLAPLIVGATIGETWWDWPPVVRHPAPAVFADGLRGRRVERVGRRAVWLVLDLSDAMVLAGPERTPGAWSHDGELAFVVGGLDEAPTFGCSIRQPCRGRATPGTGAPVATNPLTMRRW